MRRVRARRAHRLPRRGPPAALAAVAGGPPHRARHQRDEPVPAAPRARARPRPPRRAPAADRHGLRPVRLPRPRRPDLRALLRRSRFVVVGTPAGITLAPEGGAHQSTITPSIGLELPGLTYAEPAYARALDWLLCDGLADLARPDGGSLYLRLSTRPLDQAPFAAAVERLGADALRADVLAGGYRLREPDGPADVVLAACGRGRARGRSPRPRRWRPRACRRSSLDLTSPDRLYRGWREQLRAAARTAGRPDRRSPPRGAAGAGRAARCRSSPSTTPPATTWPGSAACSARRVVPVGVDEFGQSGSIPDLYGLFDLLPDQLVNAALVALD